MPRTSKSTKTTAPKSTRTKSTRTKKSEVTTPKEEAVMPEVTTTALAVVTEPEIENKATVPTTSSVFWVLTLKDKKAKAFSNTVICTDDKNVVMAFLDTSKKNGMSFISMASTDRIEEYVYNGVITKLMAVNLRAIRERKVPGDHKEMFAKVLEAIANRTNNDNIVIPVEDDAA